MPVLKAQRVVRRAKDRAQAGTNASRELLPVSSSTEAILAEKYREATRTHLKHLPKLFKSLTGLRCHVLWSHNGSQQWDEHALPTHSPLCRCLTQRNPGVLSRCCECARRHLAQTLKAGHASRPFTCFLGVHNYWLPIIVRRKTIGLAYVQTLDPSAATPCAKQDSTVGRCCPNSPAPKRRSGRACRAAKQMRRAEFSRASRLLQLIFGHAESLTLSKLRQVDLLKTQDALEELRVVATHLRQDLNGLMPILHTAAPNFEPLSRSERIAQTALDHIRQHYKEPITLQKCANMLGLSPSYLSSLFSRHVGLTFKAYLTEVRLETARELLGYPELNISQVSGAVGYASENRFRIAFRTATGLSPKAWRERLRMQPQPPPMGEGI